MLDELWYLADEADQRAERVYHRLTETYGDVLEFRHARSVGRDRFRTLAERIRDTGAPYGAHTIVHRPDRAIVLVRHDAVGKWVLPGGQQEGGESFRAAAERELAEEADIRADYNGLAYLTRVDIRWNDHATWGVMPVFAARAGSGEPEATDPDGEISAARWFTELPGDTRDRGDLRTWRERELG